jgi:hypothetical protein
MRRDQSKIARYGKSLHKNDADSRHKRGMRFVEAPNHRREDVNNARHVTRIIMNFRRLVHPPLRKV